MAAHDQQHDARREESQQHRHSHARLHSHLHQVALAIVAWQIVAVLVLAAAWAMCEAGSPAQFASLTCETITHGFGRPEVLAALAWTGLVTTAGCAYAEANVLKEISSSEAMVLLATHRFSHAPTPSTAPLP